MFFLHTRKLISHSYEVMNRVIQLLSPSVLQAVGGVGSEACGSPGSAARCSLDLMTLVLELQNVDLS